MIIRRGFPHQLYFDEDFMRIIGAEDNSDPEKNYRLWEECVHPDDMPLVKEAIESTQHNIRAEVKYRWRHKTRGLYTAYSTGMLAGKGDGCVTIYGFFKGVPADRTQLYGYDPDLQLLTRLLAEKMLDSFAFCALVDLQQNKLMLLNDYFNTGSSAGCGSPAPTNWGTGSCTRSCILAQAMWLPMKEKHLWMKAMVWSNGRLTPWLLLSSCPCRK